MYIGTGTTVSFGGSPIGEILDLTPPGVSRETVQSSTMGTVDAHTFLGTKLYDGGEVSMEVAFNPGATWVIGSGDAAQSMVITFPDSGGTTWTFDAIVTGYEPADPLEDRMTATITFKVDGDITIT